MKDYFNSVVRPSLERMERTMGVIHIPVQAIPSVATISVREHCHHLEVIGGECANPECRLVIEDDPRDYEE